ncbi:MAG: spore germination protein, partial [Clostridia bacterium]|nr:spore germination protein [Clostridia bacterium]
SDDYYSQPVKVTFLRILRLVGVVLAVLLPGTYLAIQIYHYKILPTEFLITIMDTTQGIPFTPFTEVLFIVLLFEILYEANLHMPQYMGMALSIVGALILGETAVNAGLVSPPTVMIVALSGLTFYVVPNQASQFSMLRLLFIFAGATLGLFGVLVLAVWVVSYLCSFDSYESAYLAPATPYINSDMKDFLVKAPLMNMKYRPQSIANNKRNRTRQK